MRPRFLLALLPLCLLAARSHHQGLPPIPTVVYSRSGPPVPVTLVKVVDCPMGHDHVTPPNVIGCYSTTTRVIQIADTLTLEWQQFVVGHEMVHVAARDDGLPYAGILEEAYATAWGRYRLAELLAQP